MNTQKRYIHTTMRFEVHGFVCDLADLELGFEG